MKYFWTNTIWYVLLGISVVAELVFIFSKIRKRKPVIALYLTIMGVAFAYETVIYCFLKAYDYYPKIILKSQFDDGHAGNIFSQALVSSTALLSAVYNLKHYWHFIFAVIFGLIEELFLVLGIYKHNWYHTWMTVVGIILFCRIVEKMYRKTLDNLMGFWRYIFMFFGLFSIHTPLLTWPFKLSEYQTFSTNILPDPVISYMTLFIINYILLSNTMLIMYFLNPNIVWKSISMLAIYTAYIIAYKFNLFYVREGWFFIFTTAEIFVMYLSVILLDKLFGSKYNKQH